MFDRAWFADFFKGKVAGFDRPYPNARYPFIRFSNILANIGTFRSTKSWIRTSFFSGRWRCRRPAYWTKRVDPDDVAAPKMVEDNLVGNGEEGPVGTLSALDAGFPTDAPGPFIRAGPEPILQ